MSSSADAEFTVLGADGYLGSAMVEHLKRKGARVRAVSRGGPAGGLGLDRPMGHVIYAIGVTADFRTRPFDTIEAHVCQINILLQKGDFDTLTYISSTRVYEESTETHEEAKLALAPGAPSSLYALSKLVGESISLNSGRAGVRIVRLSNVVGGSTPQQSFIDQLLAEGRSTGRIVLMSDLSSEKDYIALDDVPPLIEKIATSGRHRAYNIASGRQTTNREVLGLIARITGWPVTVTENAPVISFPPIAIVRIADEFGYSPAAFESWFSEHVRHHANARQEAP